MIPVCTPFLTGKELQYVTDCFKTNWISSQGKYISEFEEKFSVYCNVKFGVATTNGTTALHLALAALGIKKGDEVIVPSFTMISTVFAICYVGAKPVLVDAELDTGNIDVSLIEKKITKKTKAILPVHIYGHPCDMDPIRQIAKKYNLYVVEDAAEAHGAFYKGKIIGSLSDVACFSFYANKIITCGEGGMVLTSNKKIAEKLKLLKNLSFIKRRFIHHEIGFNYRMTNIQAAIGLAQLENIDKFVNLRRKHAFLYNNLLNDIDWINTPVEKSYAKNVYWMYGITLKGKMKNKKKAFVSYLKDKGVETRDFFIGMHRQPVFKKMGLFRGEKYPTTDILAATGLYLPSGSGLKEEQIKSVVKIIKSF
ncbi:MAG: DegT/DnrJ/EryC1/StrS family aminotransferase [Candidatus Omnitrophica bacterium]|nr:DegT/DnrJ/EryC1/StrS family aminotransferase [Candidatus Omnitrophota bacterium]MDD5352452.1 DegT/DnrJ/EryC1/StrS family aminotransferase [Candidatus Omnitrophota bacterium]MDD5550050.1 DegT/DnrJ/EryC1/StrS family aminotransferase [Candidatus Omnitrophota bacterium]